MTPVKLRISKPSRRALPSSGYVRSQPAHAPVPNVRVADDPAFRQIPRALLLRFGCWSGGQIGVVGIDNTLPLPVRLLPPDLDEFAGITDRRSAFRILDRESE